MKPTNAKVSVIIPSRTKEEFENSRLSQDLENQTYDNYEIITIFNRGISEAWNIGKSQAQGDIILFTETDACLPEDWIEKMVENVENNNGFAMGSEVVTSSRAWTFSTVGVRASILMDYNFDEYLKRAGDTDFFQFIKKQGFELKREREPVVYHHKGSAPIKELKFAFLRGIHYVYMAGKYYPSEDMTFSKIFKSRAFHVTKEVLQLCGTIVGFVKHFPLLVKKVILRK